MDIVLVEPKIPQNTGSIARTCAATNTALHLIEPLGFEITDKNVRRAGLDYWPHVKLETYQNWDEYVAKNSPGKIWLFTKFAETSYDKVAYSQDDALVFGAETTGLGKEFISKFPPEQSLLIPVNFDAVRSLNLSNAVSIALYEALRQQGWPSL